MDYNYTSIIILFTGTLLNRLLKEYPQTFSKCVSHTTRAPRAGETNGIDYHFVTRDEFEALIAENQFIEYAYVHTNIYGTSIGSVQDVARTGKICILEIDVQGAEKVSKTTLDPYYLFIHPPTFDALVERLRGRQSEDEDAIRIRLETAKKEIQFSQDRKDLFHVQLVNDDLNETYETLKKELHIIFPNIVTLQ
jgi:guanylate kinase